MGRRIVESALFDGLPVRRALTRFLVLVLFAPLAFPVAPRAFRPPPGPDCPLCGHACCCPDICRPLLQKQKVVPGRCDRESLCRSPEERPAASLGFDSKNFPALDRCLSGGRSRAGESRSRFFSPARAVSFCLRPPPRTPPPRLHPPTA
jgi:hypothetical protein